MLKQGNFSRILSLCIFLLLGLLPAKSSSDFYFQNPNRIGHTLNCCVVIDSNTQIAVGNHGTIVLIDMTISTITPINGITTDDLFGVCFFRNRGWIAAEGGKIFISNDKGLNWEEGKTGIINNLHSVYFIDSLTGWVTAKGGILLKTIDAGKTWNKDTTWYSDSIINKLDLSSIVFTDSLQGWILAYNGELLYTKDKGVHWSYRKIFESSGGSITGINFHDNSDTGYISTSKGRVYVTYDNSKSWSNLYVNNNCSFDAVFTSNSHLNLFGNSKYYDVYSGVYADVWSSSDAGVNWKQEWIDTGVYLNSFTELFDGSILAVGAFGTILKWMPLSKKMLKISAGITHHLHNIHFIDTLNGFAVGGHQSRDSTYSAKGIILSTSDGGKTWKEKFSFSGYTFSSIYFHDAQNGWVFGGDDYYQNICSVIFHTSDGGNTWNIQQKGSETFFSCSYFLNNDTGWTAGARGVVYKTDDGGNNWHRLETSTDSWIYDIQFFNQDIGWATAGSNLLITKNSGQSWSEIELPTQQFPLTLFFLDSLNGWIGGPRGCILRSFDGGASWTSISNSIFDSLYFYDILFFDTLNGYAVGMTINSGGFIANTADGGKSWGVKKSGISHSLQSLFSIDSTNVWACGKWGTILSHNINSDINSSVSKAHSNFNYSTNHFPIKIIKKNGNINFKLDAPDNSIFSLMIFDINGRVVWKSPIETCNSSQIPHVKGPSLLTSGLYLVSTALQYNRQLHKSTTVFTIP